MKFVKQRQTVPLIKCKLSFNSMIYPEIYLRKGCLTDTKIDEKRLYFV